MYQATAALGWLPLAYRNSSLVVLSREDLDHTIVNFLREWQLAVWTALLRKALSLLSLGEESEELELGTRGWKYWKRNAIEFHVQTEGVSFGCKPPRSCPTVRLKGKVWIHLLIISKVILEATPAELVEPLARIHPKAPRKAPYRRPLVRLPAMYSSQVGQ